MHSLFSMRPYRILTTLIPLTILMGCGEGDGPARTFNEPADPFAGPPASCFEALTFEDICDQAINFVEFEGAPGRIVDNPDQGGINPSAKVAEFVKLRAASGATFGGTIVDFSAIGFDEINPGDVVTMKVWSQRPVNLLVEPEGGGPGSGQEVRHGGTGWEELTFTFNFSGNTSGYVFIFDNGTNGDGGTDPLNWTFYADDISEPMGGGGGGPATTLPVDFEADAASYDFGPDGGFEGGAASVIANPDASGINTSAQVGQMQKFPGAVFGGATLAIEPTTVEAGSSFTMKVWSQRAVPVLLQPEPQGPGSGIEVAHGGTGWEELTFSLPGLAGTVSGITLIFDNGTAGAADTDPTNWTFYFDDITLVPPGGGGGPATTLPVDFEADAASYDFGPDGGFEGGAASVIANPDASGINTSAQVGQMQKFPGAVFGGATLAIEPTTVEAGSSFTMKVWSQRAVPVLLQPEPQGPGSGIEVAHGGTGWEELTFSLPGLAGTVSGITLIFDNGTAGAADTDPTNWTFYFDDITLVPPGGGGGSGVEVDFETAGTGAGFTWTVFENGDNPPLEIIANPDASGANTSATVAQFTARQAGQPFAGTITTDLPTFTLDASNAIVTIKVWKSVISDVGIKFENATQGSTGEIRVANTVTNQWEELTFDFSGVIGDPNNTDITGLVIFPDFDARTQENVIYFDDIDLSDGGNGGTGATSFDFESGTPMFSDFEGGVATVIANPDVSGINTSSQVGQMQKFAGATFGGSTLDLGGTVALTAGDSYTMKVRATRPVDVTLKLETQGDEAVASHTGSGTWEELCFDFAGVSGDIVGLTLIFDNGTAGDAANDPDNWTFQFDDIQQTSSACPTGGGTSLGPVDFEPNGQGEAFSWTVFENGDNPPLTVIDNPDATGANTSGRVAQFTARQAGQPFAGTVTSDLPTFTLDASNAIVKIKVWKSVISDVGIKFENASQGSTGEIKVANTVTNQWEELTFDFSGVIGDPNNTDITGLVIFPDFDARTQENVIYFDDITFEAVPTTGGGLGPVDFEAGGQGAAFAWTVFENGDNPPLTIIANPDATGANTSATVAQFTARQAGQPFAGTVTSDLPTFTLDASNAIVKIKVWKSVISDVGIKFENATQGSTGEIKVANTLINQWEELTFDFSGVIGDPNNTDITGLVIFPDFDARTQENVIYFDDITFEAVPAAGGLGPVDFEAGGLGAAFAWTVFENGDNPPLTIIANPDATGANTSATVAQFTARQAGQQFAGTVTSDLPTFTLDASNAIVKIKVWKSVISDVGIKFENASQGSTGEIKVANTVTNQWEELTFDFSGVIGDPNNTDITGLVIFPDFDARTQENVIYFDDITFEAVPAAGGLGPVDFESASTGAGFTWNVFENGDNPPLEIIANPDATGVNTSATVAQFTARQAGQPFAGTITADLPTFTLDASNAIVKILVWKPEISDVGIKFENGTGGSTGEIKVANTLINQWEELTFDFSGVIGDPNNTDITGLVIFPDFNARAQENVIYFDNITFSAAGAGGGGSAAAVDFETGGAGAAFAWSVFENVDNPPLEIIANPDATGVNTSATVAKFTARQAGQPFAGTITSDLPTFTLDASNAIVTIKVWKPVISDVGIKFENGSAGSTGEIKVANTVTNQWEELTFDFSGVIGDPNNTDITGLIVFPDFDARTQENIVYFDDISFSATGGGG